MNLLMRETLQRRGDGKGWTMLGGFEKRQRFWIKIAIAAVVVGAMVGIAIGITKAVGGGVFKSPDSTQEVGSS